MKKILFRLDANSAIGYGHFIRCQALADAFLAKQNKEELQIKFIMRNKAETPYEVIYLNTRFSQECTSEYVYESIDNEIDEIEQILKDEKPDCLIVDHYGVSKRYFEQIRSLVPLFVLFDDCNEVVREYPVDIILNGNCYGEKIPYGNEKILLLGSRYGIMRKEFTNCPEKKIHTKVTSITITTGGSDPLGVTECIVDILNQSAILEKMDKKIIIGKGFTEEAISRIRSSIEGHAGYTLLENADMEEQMELSDLWITSSGSTLNELAATGTPSLSFLLSEDQVLIGKTMDELEITCNVGWIQNITAERFLESLYCVMENPLVRQKMSRKGQQQIDGKGAQRAAYEILDRIE